MANAMKLTPTEIQKIQRSIIRWRYTSIRDQTGSEPEEHVYVGFIDIERKEGFPELRAEVVLDKGWFDKVYLDPEWNRWRKGRLPKEFFE